MDSPTDNKHELTTVDTAGGIVGFEVNGDELPPGYFRSKFFLGSMAAICVSLWGGVSAFAFAAPILSVINEDIGPDPAYTWIALIYNVTIAVIIAPLGRLSDIFGRRYFFVACAALGVLGSIICATAQNVKVLIGGNVFLGVASAAALSFNYTLSEIVPMKYRYIASGVAFMFTVPGSGCGAIFAYSFIQNHPGVGWRGVYWLLFAIEMLSFILFVLFYFPPSFAKKHLRDENQSKMFWIKNFDYIGTFLYAAGLVIFIMGLSWGGAQYPWKHPATISAIVVGLALMVIFVLWEIYAPLKEPLMPLRVVKNREWMISALLTSIGASIYYAFAVVWPAQASILYSNGDLIWLGAVASALSLAINGGQIISGFLINKIGYSNWQETISLLGVAGFLGGAACSTPYNFSTAISLIVIGNFLVGWNETIAIMNAAICVNDQKDIGIAAGLAGSMRSAVSAIAGAIYIAVLTTRLTQTIPAEVPPALIQAGLPSSSVAGFITALSSGSATALKAVPGITDAITAAGTIAYKEANAHAYRTVYLTTLAFTGLALLLSFWAPNTTKYMSNKVAATLHNEEHIPDAEKMEQK
ncbi:MFS general substrate transporter [Tothia fuscella]|uniref:MFS general substrate transporter n=1 Tax=Tothia fuscella TaxID=1048955 RepID=A0A9P4TTL6_9PEZI|nr:MFS general substrate transporter [Tothia fuscella]